MSGKTRQDFNSIPDIASEITPVVVFSYGFKNGEGIGNDPNKKTVGLLNLPTVFCFSPISTERWKW